MKDKPITILDFDEAVDLARRDPEAFEQYRQDIVRVLINRAPERNRQQLRRLQWRIDQERNRASNPIDACLKLYRMMWDAYAGERGLIDTIHNAHRSRRASEHIRTKAEVIAFCRPGSSGNNSET
ncbi:MAG: DUF3135 domain-containing protein [Thiotrichales bacterium]|nr:MAG: DUF3135 domain-containing protein [Thiotrichales bacterium]